MARMNSSTLGRRRSGVCRLLTLRRPQIGLVAA
jgi:hypothetical protein